MPLLVASAAPVTKGPKKDGKGALEWRKNRRKQHWPVFNGRALLSDLYFPPNRRPSWSTLHLQAAFFLVFFFWHGKSSVSRDDVKIVKILNNDFTIQ